MLTVDELESAMAIIIDGDKGKVNLLVGEGEDINRLMFEIAAELLKRPDIASMLLFLPRFSELNVEERNLFLVNVTKMMARALLKEGGVHEMCKVGTNEGDASANEKLRAPFIEIIEEIILAR